MKRLVIALLALGFLLTGCAQDWSGEVRYKVESLHEGYESVAGGSRGPYARLLIDGAEPEGTVQPVSPTTVELDGLPEGIAVGDVLVCLVNQHDDNNFDGTGPSVSVTSCKPA